MRSVVPGQVSTDSIDMRGPTSLMTSGFPGAPFGGSPFDDFFQALPGRPGARRGMQRVDITQLLSEQSRELVGRGRTPGRRVGRPGPGRRAPAAGRWPAHEPTRHPAAARRRRPRRSCAARLEAQLRRGEPTDQPPTLTPAAKRALLDAHQVSRASGSTYIGPEHLLFALVAEPRLRRPAGCWAARGSTPEALQRAAAGGPAVARGGSSGGGDQPPSSTPTLDQFGRDLTAMARDGRARPGHRPGRRDRADRRGPLPPHQEQPGADRRGRRRQDRDRRGPRPRRSSTATCPSSCASKRVV